MCLLRKGVCHGGNAVAAVPSQRTRTLAERQVRGQREADAGTRRQRTGNGGGIGGGDWQAMQKEIKALKAQILAGKTTGDAPVDVEGDAEEDMVEKLREQVAKLETIPGAEAVLADKQAQLKAAMAARQVARPVHQQLRDLEGKLDRKTKALKRKADTEVPALRAAADAASAALKQAENDKVALEAEIEEMRVQKTDLLAAQASTALASQGTGASDASQRIALLTKGLSVQELGLLHRATAPNAPAQGEGAHSASSAIGAGATTAAAEDDDSDEEMAEMELDNLVDSLVPVDAAATPDASNEQQRVEHRRLIKEKLRASKLVGSSLVRKSVIKPQRG
jgi:chromosome segregation ATPase